MAFFKWNQVHSTTTDVKNKQKEDVLSTTSTIAPSKSRLSSFQSAFRTEKFLNDPTRTSHHPDVVGYYYDPMSCGPSVLPSLGQPISCYYDVTNTGA